MNEFEKNELLSMFLANDGFVVVHRSIIKLFGNSCANFLAELISEYNYYKKEDKLVEKDGKLWFFSTIKNIEENIGFTKEQQIRLIKNLSNYEFNGNVLSIISTKQMGMPQQRYFTIDFDVIYSLLKSNPDLINKGYKKNKIDKNDKFVKNSVESVDFSRSSKTQLQEVVNDNLQKVQNTTSSNSKIHFQESVKDAPNNNNITILDNNNNNNLIYSEREEENVYGFQNVREIIDAFNKNIDFNTLNNKYKAITGRENDVFNAVYNQIISILGSEKKYFIVSGEKINKATFVNKILSYNSKNIENIINGVLNNKKEVSNVRNYIIATIFYEAENNELKILNNKKMTRDEYNEWVKNKYN